MIKRKKTQAQIDLKNRLIIGLWVGIIGGFIIGFIGGAFLTSHNIVAKDVQEIKAEIRITVEEMKLEQIEMNELAKMIRGWQMEIDEVWLYYGMGLTTRVMSSEEGRPSKED